MATALQVNASTQQAVGAFNALAQSIATATQQFNNLNRSMANGNAVARGYSGQITAINTAFNSLTKILSGAFDAVQRIGAGILLVFNSIIKELNKLQGFNAIMSVTTKSSEQTAESYNFLRKTADQLGVQFDSLTGNYAKLLAAMPPTLEGLRATQNIFLGIAQAARTLHSTNADTQLMFYAVTQMASKGAVSMEELRRQLGEKLPGVMQIAARALSTTPELLEKAIRTGTVNSIKFIDYFGAELIRTFQEPAEKAASSVSASLNRLTNVWVDFVKEILDSGAGQSIAGVFDAIREKLSDPYVIEQFAEMVKRLADRFTEFVKNLTQEDIRTGFDALSNGISAVATVMEKLVSLLQWVINNGKTAGAIIGGLVGAATGAITGPVGAVVGAGVGASVGIYAGSQLQSSPEQRAAQAQSHERAVEAARQKRLEQQTLMMTQLIPLLGQFKGLDTLKGLENLWKEENLNTRTLERLNDILKNPKFKTDAQKADAVRSLAQYGTVLSPRGTLADVTGPAKSKSSNKRDALADDQMRAVGLDPKFYERLSNYQKSFNTGKLSLEQYTDAVTTLIQKQPFAIELAKEQRKEQEALSKATSDYITQILQGIEAKERLTASLDEQYRITQLLGPYAEAEAQLIMHVNDLKAAGASVTQREVDLLREKLQYLDDARRVQSATQDVLNRTIYRNRDTDVLLQGMDRAAEFGASSQDLTNYAVGQQPALFSGTEEYYTFQRQQADDLISYFDALRQRNLISEQTYASLIMQQQVALNAERLRSTQDFFGNLASLSRSGNSRIAAIGKAAAVTQATIDGILAVQKAMAAPPGWPYNAPNVIAVGVAQAANVAQIASTGFMSGGYTGDGNRNRVAGVVHGQEYVVNASATARNRAALEAMNAGATVGGANVVVNNYAGNDTAVNVRERNDGSLQIDVRREAVNAFAEDVGRGGVSARAISSRFGMNNGATLNRRRG